MDNKSNYRRPRQKKKHTARNVMLVILAMIVLFFVTFIIFFRMLGGSFGSGEAATASPSPMPTPIMITDPPSEHTVITQQPVQKPRSTPVPTRKPVPTADNGSYTTTSDYLYETDKRLISALELDSYERQEIKLIYYEIYARHGATFYDDALINYFESKTWYVPKYSDDADAEAEFNSIERENIRIIEDYQRGKGWRK